MTPRHSENLNVANKCRSMENSSLSRVESFLATWQQKKEQRKFWGWSLGFGGGAVVELNKWKGGFLFFNSIKSSSSSSWSKSTQSSSRSVNNHSHRLDCSQIFCLSNKKELFTDLFFHWRVVESGNFLPSHSALFQDYSEGMPSTQSAEGI